MLNQVKECILSLPEVARWPEMVEAVLAGKPKEHGRAMWEYPFLACRAVGGEGCLAIPGMAAIAAMMIGIHQIDDMLDGEPDGAHKAWGWGRTANMASAFQLAALQIPLRAGLDCETASAIVGALGEAGMNTAWGQELDVTGYMKEEIYWRSVDAKTPPLLGAGFLVGALLGGATLETAQAFYQLGGPLGRLIQIGDDLDDAFESPARSDWRTRSNNLAILFAHVAEYPEKERFLSLVDRVDEPEALAEAQQLLIGCGALSYCCYHYIKSYAALVSQFEALALVNPGDLGGFVHGFLESLRDLFEAMDLDFPEEFLG